MLSEPGADNKLSVNELASAYPLAFLLAKFSAPSVVSMSNSPISSVVLLEPELPFFPVSKYLTSFATILPLPELEEPEAVIVLSATVSPEVDINVVALSSSENNSSLSGTPPASRALLRIILRADWIFLDFKAIFCKVISISESPSPGVE